MYKKLFFQLIVKPIILLIAGISVKGKENIPNDQPYLIVANHNSHLDALVIMSMYDSKEIINISPVAASDYFFRNKYLKWIAVNLIGITPLNRVIKKSSQTPSEQSNKHPLDAIYNSIQAGKNLIIFPEGSRGKPEQLQKFKSGIVHIAKKYPDLAIVPVVLENTGKSLPKNEALFVPLIIKINIKAPFTFNMLNLDGNVFIEKLEQYFRK